MRRILFVLLLVVLAGCGSDENGDRESGSSTARSTADTAAQTDTTAQSLAGFGRPATDAESAAVTGAFDEVRDAMAARDWRKGCDLQTPGYRRQQSCEVQSQKLFAVIESRLGGSFSDASVARVRISGDVALAFWAIGDSAESVTALKRSGQEWTIGADVPVRGTG